MTRKIVFWVALVIVFLAGCLTLSWLSSLFFGVDVGAVATLTRMGLGGFWGLVLVVAGMTAWDRWVA